MKTLAEVIYENRKWVRTLGDIPRFNTIEERRTRETNKKRRRMGRDYRVRA